MAQPPRQPPPTAAGLATTDQRNPDTKTQFLATKLAKRPGYPAFYRQRTAGESIKIMFKGSGEDDFALKSLLYSDA